MELTREIVADNQAKEGFQIVLEDGRKLAYHQYGAENGFPIFYFHGWPSSALDGAVLHGVSIENDIRIIAVNRPGIGQSDFQPDRQLLDFPDDIMQLTDTLGLDVFSVLGQSGGGPYALACAYKLNTKRLIATGVVASMFSAFHPISRAGIQPYPDGIAYKLMNTPVLLRLLLAFNSSLLKVIAPDTLLKALIDEMPEIDRSTFNQADVLTAMSSVLTDMRTASSRGLAMDAHVIMNRWGFDLSDIEVPVTLWHGEADNTVPVAASQWYASQILNCEFNLYPDEGHGVLLNHAETILTRLLP